jgi:hypothetical protein
MNRIPGFAKACLAVLLMLTMLIPAFADEARQKRAFELIRDAKKHIRNSRQSGFDSGKENEKAIILLEEAVGLLEKEVEADESNNSMLASLQDAAALLFWCHKMAPISTERKETFEKKISEEEKKVEKKAIAKGASADQTAVVKRRNSRAENAYSNAKDYETSMRQGSATDRRFEIMARYFQIADQYSDTKVAIDANKASLRIQKEIFGGTSIVIKAKGKGDKKALEKVARVVMAARKKLNCLLCKGKIVIACRKCKGRGWKFRYYGGRKIDWGSSRPCRTCNPTGKTPRGSPEPRNGPNAGLQKCRKSFCRFGLEQRSIKKLFWTLRTTKYRQRTQALLKGIPADMFIEAVIVCLNPSASEHKDSVLDKLAKELSLDRTLIEESAVEAIKGREEWTRMFNSSKHKVFADGRVDVTLLIYKPKRSISEEMNFVWADGGWFFKDKK